MIKRVACLQEFLLGHFESARQNMESLIESYDAARDGPQAGMTTRDPKAAMGSFLGVCLTILGCPDSGTARVQEGIAYAKNLNHPVSLNLGLRRACVQGILRRDIQRVVELSSELAALRMALETYQGSWEGDFFQDWAQLCVQLDPVRFDRMHAFLHHFDRSNIRALLPFYISLVAELHGRYGESGKASALVERASEIISITGSRWCEAEVTRLRARFGTRNSEQAVALLQSALAKAREQGARLWELRAATDLARLLLNRQDPAGAGMVLTPVYKSFGEGKETADCGAARALLDEIGTVTG